MTTAEAKFLNQGSRNYAIVSILAVLLALISTTIIVGLESFRNYHELKLLAKIVTLANVAAAQKSLQQFSLQFAFIKVLYLVPIVATLGVLSAVLWRRALPVRTRRICFEDWFSLYPIPLIALTVFFLFPTPPITAPFSSDLWLTEYSPEARAKIVDSLLTTVKYQGMTVSSLRSLLGVPNQQQTLPNKSGSIGYSISESGRTVLHFYYNEKEIVTDAKVINNARIGID